MSAWMAMLTQLQGVMSSLCNGMEGITSSAVQAQGASSTGKCSHHCGSPACPTLASKVHVNTLQRASPQDTADGCPKPRTSLTRTGHAAAGAAGGCRRAQASSHHAFEGGDQLRGAGLGGSLDRPACAAGH